MNWPWFKESGKKNTGGSFSEILNLSSGVKIVPQL